MGVDFILNLAYRFAIYGVIVAAFMALFSTMFSYFLSLMPSWAPLNTILVYFGFFESLNIFISLRITVVVFNLTSSIFGK